METKRSSIITFRLDENTVKKLKIESHNMQISTNTLVNQALKRYLEWDMLEPKAGFVSLSRPVFVKIFEKFSEDDIREIAQNVGKDEIRDIVFFMKGKVDMDTFLSWFETRMSSSSVQVSHRIEDKTHTYVMKHNLGRNWSVYNTTLLESIFREVFEKPIRVTCEKSMFSFQFED